ncbi:MAG: acyloxyacyl hydrolase [Candidatus Omnitrophota bacterium]
MRKIFILALIICFAVAIPSRAKGEKLMRFQGIEYLSGWGRGELIEKKDYHLLPLLLAFDFDIKPLTRKIGFNPPSLVQFQIEPFLGLVTQPDTNIEVGNSFLLKLGLLPETSKFQPYIKGGAGMVWMSQHTLDQSTQFNFLLHFGSGMHYFFNKDYAFTAEYRFRHLSNSSIKQPNRGIDVHFALIGLTRLF